MSRRVAIVATPEAGAVHGLDGAFEWGEARTFTPDDITALTEWAPGTVIAIATPPPVGTWRTIAWGGPGERRVGTDAGTWRRSPLPAADTLSTLRAHAGENVLVVSGDTATRESALKALRARGFDPCAAATLTHEDLVAAAVVAVLGAPGEPLPSAAPAVLVAARLLIVPRAEPSFGLTPWIDHVPYDHVDDIAWAADAARIFPSAFEAIVAMGVVAADAYLASAIYGRLAIDAEEEDGAA